MYFNHFWNADYLFSLMHLFLIYCFSRNIFSQSCYLSSLNQPIISLVIFIFIFIFIKYYYYKKEKKMIIISFVSWRSVFITWVLYVDSVLFDQWRNHCEVWIENELCDRKLHRRGSQPPHRRPRPHVDSALPERLCGTRAAALTARGFRKKRIW